MTITQFAMVQELASLVEDNLSCKYLILSMEKSLLDFLENGSSYDDVLELKPMNSYERLLLHRLADIFGFEHKSVGEGEYRHMVLQRSAETSIPPILISDLICHHDHEPERSSPPTRLRLLKRPDVTSHEAKREGRGEGGVDGKTRPRNVPTVARRMISRALGRPTRVDYASSDGCEEEEEEETRASGAPERNGASSNSRRNRNNVHGWGDDTSVAAKRMFALAMGKPVGARTSLNPRTHVVGKEETTST